MPGCLQQGEEARRSGPTLAQSWVKRNTAWDLAETGFWETLLPPGGGSQNDPMVGRAPVARGCLGGRFSCIPGSEVPARVSPPIRELLRASLISRESRCLRRGEDPPSVAGSGNRCSGKPSSKRSIGCGRSLGLRFPCLSFSITYRDLG